MVHLISEKYIFLSSHLEGISSVYEEGFKYADLFWNNSYMMEIHGRHVITK
jgi:hypothetical protein